METDYSNFFNKMDAEAPGRETRPWYDVLAGIARRDFGYLKQPNGHSRKSAVKINGRFKPAPTSETLTDLVGVMDQMRRLSPVFESRLCAEAAEYDLDPTDLPNAPEDIILNIFLGAAGGFYGVTLGINAEIQKHEASKEKRRSQGYSPPIWRGPKELTPNWAREENPK